MHVFNNQIQFLERESEKLDLKTLVKKEQSTKFYSQIFLKYWV